MLKNKFKKIANTLSRKKTQNKKIFNKPVHNNLAAKKFAFRLRIKNFVYPSLHGLFFFIGLGSDSSHHIEHYAIL